MGDNAISRVEAALTLAEQDGFTPEVEQVFIDDLPAVIAFAKAWRSLDRLSPDLESHGGVK